MLYSDWASDLSVLNLVCSAHNSADVLAPMATGTSGAEDSSASPLTSSLCDALMLSPMPIIGGHRNFQRYRDFQLISNTTEDLARS